VTGLPGQPRDRFLVRFLGSGGFVCCWAEDEPDATRPVATARVERRPTRASILK
jgi:hypothetical protein